jgi:hypothetical protein
MEAIAACLLSQPGPAVPALSTSGPPGLSYIRLRMPRSVRRSLHPRSLPRFQNLPGPVRLPDPTCPPIPCPRALRARSPGGGRTDSQRSHIAPFYPVKVNKAFRRWYPSAVPLTRSPRPPYNRSPRSPAPVSPLFLHPASNAPVCSPLAPMCQSLPRFRCPRFLPHCPNPGRAPCGRALLAAGARIPRGRTSPLSIALRLTSPFPAGDQSGDVRIRRPCIPRPQRRCPIPLRLSPILVSSIFVSPIPFVFPIPHAPDSLPARPAGALFWPAGARIPRGRTSPLNKGSRLTSPRRRCPPMEPRPGRRSWRPRSSRTLKHALEQGSWRGRRKPTGRVGGQTVGHGKSVR